MIIIFSFPCFDIRTPLNHKKALQLNDFLFFSVTEPRHSILPPNFVILSNSQSTLPFLPLYKKKEQEVWFFAL